MSNRPKDNPGPDPEIARVVEHIGSHVAGLLEQGSIIAAKGRTADDAKALSRLGSDVTVLSDAMAVLLAT